MEHNEITKLTYNELREIALKENIPDNKVNIGI
ncbi:MAG: hypothetical protein H6Q15_2280 [Bacteroidetes bacterium]|nr:hypothetical protein [Bacteroidota bacterium]